ncbi:MAG: 1-deoxy-D-xylulose-5-phosphate reductoisomerase [Bacteroidales bacterium]|jgi:1-deoxy-D-xylulose-5-phosphate reductoisomerase|nr:1-deoxy-D-xylulose-5-phosphate reductoisomerase [Bacteroidales bacterium]MDD2264847.1 1-deoxy-D-xylulose-5-phosphate reductoisomerase [Bacteroidales bacterium]MDD2832055.1 1-deoxy-D-xylulose-5-phosphate reductoisomerase [Bacteroidales bacterium]MDD3208751.1 1-deoxy-D-xylulose-5-phosphate reductoisomerase [Bacteroidales bacterium]MDD3697314.1 1-deoxy-D-xylulose-5-phosphate reductoisomerase [Bacteroidales bacterium]
MTFQKRIAILGSTGSIGVQALEVIRKYPGLFKVQILTARRSSGLLIRQALEFLPQAVVVTDRNAWMEVRDTLKGTPVKVLYGNGSITEVLAWDSVDMVLNALVGFIGLEPSLAALKNRKTLALANKESLVTGGHLVMREAAARNVSILPVDSEHSAVFQCLRGEQATIEKIILTASGGPFFKYSLKALESITKSQALDHPTWNMGEKVTVDSATLMNKGLEVIEAFWLFGQPLSKIEVMIHPQSLIHSMVQFSDGTIKAQMGYPDMRLPILYALSFPRRLDFPEARRMDLSHFCSMEFHSLPADKFPCLEMAYEALKKGGNIPCVLNAANEVAVDAFLNERLNFTAIPGLISRTLEKIPLIKDPTFDQLKDTHREAQRMAQILLTSC